MVNLFIESGLTGNRILTGAFPDTPGLVCIMRLVECETDGNARLGRAISLVDHMKTPEPSLEDAGF